ncbi:hypothetical protein O199_0226210, partial [Escherichia coli ATCC 35150]
FTIIIIMIFFIACSINIFLDLLVNGEVFFLIPLFFLN